MSGMGILVLSHEMKLSCHTFSCVNYHWMHHCVQHSRGLSAALPLQSWKWGLPAAASQAVHLFFPEIDWNSGPMWASVAREKLFSSLFLGCLPSRPEAIEVPFWYSHVSTANIAYIGLYMFIYICIVVATGKMYAMHLVMPKFSYLYLQQKQFWLLD